MYIQSLGREAVHLMVKVYYKSGKFLPGECSALWGEPEQVAGCISVSYKMPGEEVRASNVHASVCRGM